MSIAWHMLWTALVMLVLWYPVVWAIKWLICGVLMLADKLRPPTGGSPCPSCGYDVTATPQKCPECGTELRRGQLPRA